MNLTRKHRLAATAALCVVAVPAVAFTLFSGSPSWSLSNGFHYVADLRPASFAAGSVWDQNAQFALSDWRDTGDTVFRPGVTRLASDPNNHSDGRNTWLWTNRPNDTWLGVTYVRYSGSTMTDCDIWYNSRPDYTWTNGLTDPCEYRSYWPIEFRNVARHEIGHAIGFDHENDTLANMNSFSTHGCGVGHVTNSGIMPHADDKRGVRFLYPANTTVRNVMATNWREPSTGGARQEGEETGNWAANTTRTLEFWLANQSTVTIAGSSSGIRTGVYLSTNDLISTFDTRIYETTYSGSWGAGAAGRYAPTVRVPANMPSGNYYVGVYFDNAAFVAESGTGATESDNTCVLGRVNVTNSQRTLTVQSTNPSSAVSITASSGGNGATPFNRTFWGSSETVTLTAPGAVGNNDFRYWILNGLVTRGGATLNLTMNRNHTARAVYWDNVVGQQIRFGQPGCAGSNGVVPTHTVAHANGAQGNQQGTSTAYRLARARANALCTWYVGLNTRTFGGMALPLNLGLYGLDNGCWLNHDLFAGSSVFTNGVGAASQSITYPVDPSTVGRSVYSSYGVLDRGANTAGVVFSNSMRTIVGGNRP